MHSVSNKTNTSNPASGRHTVHATLSLVSGHEYLSDIESIRTFLAELSLEVMGLDVCDPDQPRMYELIGQINALTIELARLADQVDRARFGHERRNIGEAAE